MSVSQEVTSYINDQPPTQRAMLTQIRDTVTRLRPNAEEVISYKIPAFRLNDRMLAYYAGWHDHISVYPIPHVDEEMLKGWKPFIKGKGTLWFSTDKPLPIEIIEQVVLAHIERNEDGRK